MSKRLLTECGLIIATGLLAWLTDSTICWICTGYGLGRAVSEATQ